MRAFGDPLDTTSDEFGMIQLRDVLLWCTEDELRRLHAYIGTVLAEQSFKGKSWHVHFRHHDTMWWAAEENPDLTIVFEGDTS